MGLEGVTLPRRGSRQGALITVFVAANPYLLTSVGSRKSNTLTGRGSSISGQVSAPSHG